MYAAIRIRSSTKVNADIKDTMKSLRLTKKNTLVILPDNPTSIGMLLKVENFVAWGTASPELIAIAEKHKGVMHLQSPKGGMLSVKQKHPAGNVGYQGDAINVLAKQMM